MTIQSVSMQLSSLTTSTQAVDRLSEQYAAEQSAVSSGVTSNSFASLGDQRYQALDLQPRITEISGWQQNITSAQSRLAVTQTVMTQITGIATSLQTSLTSLKGDITATSVQSVASQARQSLTELMSLLNTKDGTGFALAGNASDQAPVTNPSSILQSNFFSAIAQSVAAVATSGASSVESMSVAVAANNAPDHSVFSASLSTDASTAASLNRTVTVGDESHVEVGFVATAGGAASNTSTGSSIRDLMRSLAVVGSLDQASSTSPEFTVLVDDTSTQLGSVSDSLSASVSGLGQTQDQLTTQASALSLVGDTLTKQLGLIKDSDPAALSAQITDTQNQLQASYSLIADMKGMSLADYI